MCIAWGVLRWVMAVTTANAINIANIFKSLLLISVIVMRWLWCHVCVYIIQSSIREINMARRNREKERSITWVCQSLDFALTEGKITQFDWKSGLPLLPSKTIANYYDYKRQVSWAGERKLKNQLASVDAGERRWYLRSRGSLCEWKQLSPGCNFRWTNGLSW